MAAVLGYWSLTGMGTLSSADWVNQAAQTTARLHIFERLLNNIKKLLYYLRAANQAIDLIVPILELTIALFPLFQAHPCDLECNGISD